MSHVSAGEALVWILVGWAIGWIGLIFLDRWERKSK